MYRQYEVLDGLPTYGAMAVPITHNNELFVSEGYVVKFFRDNGTEWIANFQLGCTDTSHVIWNDNTKVIVVIAGGIGYVINPNRVEPIRIFDYDISHFIEMNNGSMIISNEADIIILDENGTVEKRYDNIGFDGIGSLKLEENILTGLVYDINSYDNIDDAWIPFSINLKTDEIKIEYKPKEEIKHWWKFW